MKHDWPRFKLARVLDDGSRQHVEILPVHALSLETNLGRRSFFGVGSAVTTLGALALTGCGQTSSDSEVPAAESEPPTDAATEYPPDEPAFAPASPDDATTAPAYEPPSPTYYPPAPAPYAPPPPPPSYPQTSGPETITRPCTPEPVPPGYTCTCNCVAY